MLLQDGAKTDVEIGPMRTRTGCEVRTGQELKTGAAAQGYGLRLQALDRG